jgi:hypothetical protein
MLSIKQQKISENIPYRIFKNLLSEGEFNLYIKSTSCNDVPLWEGVRGRMVNCNSRN